MVNYQSTHQVFANLGTMLNILNERIPKSDLVQLGGWKSAAKNDEQLTRIVLDKALSHFNILYDEFLKTFGGTKE